MNNLGLAVSWCIAQVTVLATLAMLVYIIAGRLSPRIRGTVALTSVVCIVPLSAMIFSPWPRWNLPALPQVEIVDPAAATVEQPALTRTHVPVPSIDRDAAREPVPAVLSQATSDDSQLTVADDVLVADNLSVSPALAASLPAVNVLPDEPPVREAVAPIDSRWVTTADAPYDLKPQTTSAPESNSRWWVRSELWTQIVAACFVTSLIIGLARLLVGLAFVRSQRRWSATIENPELLDLVDLICAEAGGTRWVDVRESARISTAATIGWRRPMILLPIDWQQWSATELRAVLAHEIAHIRNRDFIAWVWAQLGLSLHFYHPLVHWLVGRLRLEQELAADALAAPLAGGSSLYLSTLAAMALRQSERPLSWPARAFLPTRDTLLRRIEMLKRPQQFSKSLFSRPVRYAAVLVILGGGIVAAGLRSSYSNSDENSKPPEFRMTVSRDTTAPLSLVEAPAEKEEARPTDNEAVDSKKTVDFQLEGKSYVLTGDEVRVVNGKVEVRGAASQMISGSASFMPKTDLDKDYVAKTTENFNKIAAALRKYRVVRGQYPSSVMTDGTKVPYSWRVALLPFLEGNEGLELYEQYNFSEPWDGPNNKKLLDKMPAVYRSALGAFVASTNENGTRHTTMATSYYMLGGPLFTGSTSGEDPGSKSADPQSKLYADFWGGPARTSNTVSLGSLIVEARRTTPWTKPSDILFDPEGPFEQLKGNHDDAYPVLDAQLKTWFLTRSAGRDKTISVLSQLRNGPARSNKASDSTENLPTLYLFYADWAGPAQQAKKLIEEVTPEVKNRVGIQLIDSDVNQNKVREFKITALPTIVICRGSTELARETGVMSKARLLQTIESATAMSADASPSVRTTLPTAVVMHEKTGMERAVAGMTVTFFQNQAKKVVPGLMLNAGDETLFITASPATFHPDGVPPAIDRLELVAGPSRADTVRFKYSEDSTNELYVARTKQRLSDFKLDEVASVSAGDKLDAAYFDESGKLNIRRGAAVVVHPQGNFLQLALDAKTVREYNDIHQVEGRYPEGSVLLKQGKFAGLVLAGTRFIRKEDDRSFFIPAERVAERYKQIRKNDQSGSAISVTERPVAEVNAGASSEQPAKRTTYRGRIVLKGDPPKLPPIDLKKFDDLRGVVVNGDLPDERLILGRDNGIKNVFIYLRKAPQGTQPASKPETNWKLAKMKIESGRFEPHVLVMNTNQAIEYRNPNGFPVNLHLMAHRNKEFNTVIGPKMSRLDRLDSPEVSPFRISSDFHPWMSAYILPLDHSFASITDADGMFEIRDLPPGTHQLHIWHEALTRPIQMTIILDGTKDTFGEVSIGVDAKSLNLEERTPDLAAGSSNVRAGVGVNSEAGVRGTVTLSEPQGTPEEFAQRDATKNRNAREGATRRVMPQQAGVAAQKTQSLNNIKQLMLAMHNYYEVHKHFPPAVVLGPDGKTPHSWRVELLPFLEQAKLYEQYKMDEPWDSPNNKKVLSQMPDVFRAPTDKKDSTNTSYFVPTGPQTMFHLKPPMSMAELQKAQSESDVAKRGLLFRDVTDGTSMTVALIETKREVPWTRPQDIDCDPTIPLPRFGRVYDDCFHVGVADGSARTFRKDVDEKSLRAVLSRDGKEAIELEAFVIPMPKQSNISGLDIQRMPQPVPEADVMRPATARPGGLAGGTSVNSDVQRSRNNLKQLMLAMHNYHDVHNNFPPAVVIGPDGKTPHSWRVEILPYLTREGGGGRTYHDLYQKYKMNEPWDSPDNKKVLAEMPDVFRAPNDKPDSTNTAYFAVVSQFWKTLVPGNATVPTVVEPASVVIQGKTLFDGVKGIRMAQITDGSSNTIALVESQLFRKVSIPVPWTEPDDIVYDPSQPLPKFAPPEGLHAGMPGIMLAMADGSAQFLPIQGMPEAALRGMLTRGGGEPVSMTSPVGPQPVPAGVLGGRRAMPAQPAPSLFQRIFGGGTTAHPAPKNDSQTNLKRIMLAMHNYHDVYNHFPAATVIGPDGKTPHSWRVELLPFLEEPQLFNEYKMDEPWDGPNNKRLLERMPAVFRVPGETADSTSSLYFAITGKGMFFEDPKGTKIGAITDGTSNTIAIVESQKREGEKAVSVPWLKPDDIVIDASKPLPNFGVKDGAARFWAALADGSVRQLSTKTSEADLRAMFTRAGNDAVVIPR